MTTRILTLIIAVSLVAIGCSSAVKNTDVSVPFSARSYPADAPAECPLDAAGNSTTGFKRIVAADEHTVRFELCAPDPAFLEKISLAPFTINDSGHLTTTTADGTINQDPIGTGPFYFKSWVDGSQIVLSKFADYWGEKAKVDTLVFNWQPDESGRTIGIESGTTDVVSNISPDDLAGVNGAGVLTYSRLPSTPAFLIMNNTYKPFDDVRVRQAIGLAMDQQRLTSNFYQEGSIPATHLVPCVIPLGCSGADWPAQDINQAKRLLAEAGFPNGFKTTISFSQTLTTGLPLPNETATDVQAQLAAIGVEAELIPYERVALRALRRDGKISGILLDSFNADFLEPSDFLQWLFVNLPKRFGVVDRSITDPINAAVHSTSIAERERLYGQANDAIRNLVPIVPLVQASSAAATGRDVTGFVQSALGYERAATVLPGDRKSLVWTLVDQPQGLWCSDTGGTLDTARICIQMLEGLYGLEGETSVPKPLLATSCVVAKDGLSWTCELRKGVRFHNGATFDAGDVLDSFAAQWDCASPFHKSVPGTFGFMQLLSPFLNAEACAK